MATNPDVDIVGQPDQPVHDDKGNLVELRHGDGSITISLDDNPLERAVNDNPESWFDNLAEKLTDNDLGSIADDLIRGIEDDIQSRTEWVESRAQGMRLLGLKLEIPGLQGETDGAPIEGMSKVRHPLLLEAVLRFQANARSELLPTDGPVKIRNDDNNATLAEDQLANALERDLNHYLTSTASEYYPDTDRMLLMLGFGGTSFKKVYYCPLRSRPVSETVDANDLIVNNEATDLANAKRITHRIMMRPSVVRRMQILEVYRDIDLGDPMQAPTNAVKEEEKSQQGLASSSMNPSDRDREIYECYCELDIPGFEHKYKGKVSGLSVPYRVTVDVSSRQILSIVRNYNEDSKELPVARKWFVKYTFVPGFGFYDIGLLHILGNTTNAVTAAWRELLDSGMYANFPGFLVAKSASRQNTSIFRVPPGGGAQIETNGQPINQAVMPLPYNAQAMAPLMSLVQDIASTGQRIGGTSEMQVGEGRADAPVGTTLAMIDQAVKVLNSVHKRMHSSQSEEFRLLCGVFSEHPEAFWQRNSKPSTSWDEATFLKALEDYDLTPQADPNTASHAQRIMKVMGLKQLQAGAPDLYDPIACDTAALQSLGWSNPQQFFKPQGGPQTPPPQVMEAMAKAQTDGKRADADTLRAQADAAETKAKIDGGFFAKDQKGQEAPNEAEAMTAHADLIDAQTNRAKLGLEAHQSHIEDANRDLDRESEERKAAMEVIREVIAHPEGLGVASPIIGPLEKAIASKEDGE
jgi:hypothetical protein